MNISIDELEVQLKRITGDIELNVNDRKAVFDLDNTLLIGDVGDAVFSMLKRMGNPLDVTWPEYLEILKKEGKLVAYSRAASCMKGISLQAVRQATEAVIASDQSQIEVEGVTVPIPRANPMMVDFLNLLRLYSFQIYVISATNIHSVRQLCQAMLDIPAENCFGLDTEVVKSENGNGEILTGKLIPPLTITTGKAELYYQKIGRIPPLVTAGDSETDIHLLNLVDPRGISIWVGDDDSRYMNIREKSTIKDRFLYMKR